MISELRDPMTAAASVATKDSSKDSSDVFFDAADSTPSPRKTASAQQEREILAKQTEVASPHPHPHPQPRPQPRPHLKV